MSNLFALSDLRDPTSFLTGARIPLAHHQPMATWQRYEWIADRLLARLCSDGAWVERVTPDWRFYCIDLSDPDVARWCDRKIATEIARSGGNLDAVTWGEIRVIGGGWDVRWSGGSGTRLNNCGVEYLVDVPHGSQHIPAARAAIIRALFGTFNA
jgi:hypothetical protein